MTKRRQNSALQKEWKERDLRRIRNIKEGNFNDSTVTQAGYEKKVTIRKEGEVFEEDGKKFIIKNGIKRKYSKLHSLREENKIPLFCPCCNKSMSHKVNQKMYRIKGMCLDCVIDFEAKLKLEGKFEAYQKTIMSANYKAQLIDLRAYIIDYTQMNKSVVNSSGEIEDWSNNDIDTAHVIQAIDDELVTL